MLKNFKIFFLDKKLVKIFFLILKNQSILGKNQIFFKKNYYIFRILNKNNLYIYNGNKFRNLKIKYFYIGLRFGNFIFTRKPFKYLIKTKLQRKNNKR